MNIDKLYDKDEQKYKKRIVKSRKRSAKLRFIYIALGIISIILMVLEGINITRLGMLFIFIFCAVISFRNKKLLKKDVIFPTEYLENVNKNSEEDEIEDYYIEPDETEEINPEDTILKEE